MLFNVIMHSMGHRLLTALHCPSSFFFVRLSVFSLSYRVGVILNLQRWHAFGFCNAYWLRLNHAIICSSPLSCLALCPFVCLSLSLFLFSFSFPLSFFPGFSSTRLLSFLSLSVVSLTLDGTSRPASKLFLHS